MKLPYSREYRSNKQYTIVCDIPFKDNLSLDNKQFNKQQ